MNSVPMMMSAALFTVGALYGWLMWLYGITDAKTRNKVRLELALTGMLTTFMTGLALWAWTIALTARTVEQLFK